MCFIISQTVIVGDSILGETPDIRMQHTNGGRQKDKSGENYMRNW